MTLGIRRFIVEIRSTYEVEAESPDAALGSVHSPDDRYGTKPIATEYTVRERSATPAPAKATETDSHGLTKPVYTTAEAAAILGIGRSTMYELARRTDGIKSIRLGRKVLIPRVALIAMLDGSISIAAPSPPPPPAPRPYRRHVAKQPVVVESPRTRKPRAQPEPAEEKKLLTMTDVAALLHVSSAKVRTLLDERKIYYIKHGNKRIVPPGAVEKFVAGLTPMATVEEHIAYAKTHGTWDDDMEQAAANLRAEWADAPSPTDA
jgi:excisionase family DNA binding protein